MSKQDVRRNLHSVLSGRSVVEFSDENIRNMLMYVIKFHGKNIAQMENQLRQQNG